MNRDMYNSEGYKDSTAYEAIRHVEEPHKRSNSEERVHKLVMTIFSICELAGFRVEGRIVLEDKKTGKIWR